MTKKIFIFLALFFILMSGAGEAFIPETPHLLYMVIQKIKQPSGLKVVQKRKIIDYHTDTSKGYALVAEVLYYEHPDRLRAQVVSETRNSFTVESPSGFIKVKEDTLVSREKLLTDRYSDILLFREYEILDDYLKFSGIDTTKVSLHRYRDTICYVIGDTADLENNISDQGLWIEKDTFFPLKYAVQKDGWHVTFYYTNWQRVSRTWYPMQISIFLDGRIFAMINAQQVELASGFSPAMFDINTIISNYPHDRPSGDQLDENTRQVDELDKRIKDFGKLLE